MQISSKNFIASQALYGLMISKPGYSRRDYIAEAYRYADAMMKESKKKRRRRRK